MTEIDHTHDAAARSWVESADAAQADFPLQNLPLGVFREARHAGCAPGLRGGVAIGEQIVDLAALQSTGLVQGTAQQALAAAAGSTLNGFFALGRDAARALRHALFDLLSSRAPATTRTALAPCLVPQQAAEFALPAHIGDYTDFYTSAHHARNILRAYGRPDTPTPNFRWMPIAYHGRASSIGISGQHVRRPQGQRLPPGATQPVCEPTAELDFELELGAFVGSGNAHAQPVAIAAAERHLAGLCLLNDWSARDLQRWESQPLGPFLAKNFATTLSPWVVMLEALAPFRVAWAGADAAAAEDHAPLPYLDHAANRRQGAFDIRLEALLHTAHQRALGAAPERLSGTSFRHQSWTLAQMLTHHTVGGCNLRPGDLIGSGTISGPGGDEAGSLLELTAAGVRPLRLRHGEQRRFLEDGDCVVLRGWCERQGFRRIGFGRCEGTVQPAAA